jgi:hypothetical protein
MANTVAIPFCRASDDAIPAATASAAQVVRRLLRTAAQRKPKASRVNPRKYPSRDGPTSWA